MVRASGSRHPLRGSASTGQPSTWARAWTPDGSSIPPPATITPRRRPTASASTSRVAGRARCRSRAGARAGPDRGRGGSAPARPTSGSRKRRSRCTGPGGRATLATNGLRGQRAPRTGHGRVGHARVDEPPHRAAVEALLIDGLGGAHAVQLGGTVGGAHQQRHLGLVGLHHRRVQLDRGRPARAQHHRRPAGGQADAERHEAGRALVVVHLDPHAPVGGQRQRHRRGPRTGRHHRVGQPDRTHSSTSVAQNVAAVVSAGSEPVTDDSLGLRTS